MRIDLFNSTASEIASEKDATQVGAQNSAGAGQVSAEDRTTLTSDTTSVGSLTKAALASPAIRQDNVDRLRAAVNGGQYELDPDKIASAIIDEQA
ncbi:MAG: flagellar biosynthesis anti-sigma factor FlgM [Acidobacteriaceae bacterium]|jgi:negative regulator of flagellin synthesis FlgM